MSYRDDYKAVERQYYWTLPRAMLAILVGVFLTALMLRPFIFASKVFNPDTVITTYERFHELHQQFASRKGQIASYKGLPPDANTRIDLMAVQQSCRDIVAKYNAESNKVNKGLFRGNSLPESLNLGDCQ